MRRIADGVFAGVIYEGGSYTCRKSKKAADFVIGGAVNPTQWRLTTTSVDAVSWAMAGRPRQGINLRRPAQFEGAAVLSAPAARMRETLRAVSNAKAAIAFPVGRAVVAGLIESVDTEVDDVRAALRYDLDDPADLNSGGVQAAIGVLIGRNFIDSIVTVVERQVLVQDFADQVQGVRLQ